MLKITKKILIIEKYEKGHCKTAQENKYGICHIEVFEFVITEKIYKFASQVESETATKIMDNNKKT